MSQALRVGRYEVMRLLGEGGMARVHLARDVQLGRAVALKELKIFSGAGSEQRRRFIREARIGAELSHRNIVVVFELFEEADTPYIAMEHVSGGDLTRYMSSLSAAQIFGILDGVLAGLEAAERSYVVHRDIKPQNVLVTSGGEVKIADFGLAKAANETMLTRTGMTAGTPRYMAPEQVSGDEVGRWADLYAVGAVAFELFTGKPPFHGESPLAIMFAHCNSPLPARESVAPDVDPRVYAWLERMLAKSPADRYDRAALARSALEDIADDLLGSRWRRSAALLPAAPPVPTEQREASSEYVDFVPPPDTNERIRQAAKRAPGSAERDAVAPPPAEIVQDATIAPIRPLDTTSRPVAREPRRRHRGWRIAGALVAGFIVLTVIAALLPQKKGPTRSPSDTPAATTASKGGAGSSAQRHATATGRMLTALQLRPVLVPSRSFKRLLPEGYGFGSDSGTYVLFGGLAALKLCNSAIAPAGLGPDTSSSYFTGDVDNEWYFGSDAASFAGAGAQRLLATAAMQARSCGWRALPGPKLGSQVVRLTTDRKDPNDKSLHTDVILVRDRGSVLEVAGATSTGTHSSDIERLADSAASRLVRAVREANRGT